MKVDNVKVYDLEESIVASGYPMMTDLDDIKYQTENLKSWNKYGNFLFDFLEYQINYDKNIGENTSESCYKCGSNNSVQFNTKENKYMCSKHNHQIERYGEVFETKPKYVLHDSYAEVYIVGDKRKMSMVIVDHEDIPIIFYAKTLNVDRYLTADGELFHRLIIKDLPDDCVVDHINKDKLCNLKENLRICTIRENSRNCNAAKNNTSGVIGVSYRKDKNKWRAYITVNRKQISLGHFETMNDAVVSRLNAEKEYFKEYSPQIHMFEEYGIDFDIKKNTYNHLNLKLALSQIKRVKSLSGTGGTSGHNQYETGIRVAFDLTFSNKAWVELERYRFVEFVSSQSTMHRISRMDIKGQVNEYVTDNTINEVNRLKDIYLQTEDKEDYLRLLYNIPSGFELTARLTTNYRALKTVYSQRKNHRLPEWREFCQWCETLPMFKELCIRDELN